MKLPGINYTQRVTSLGREDNSAVRAELAKGRAVQQATGAVGGVIFNAAMDYHQRQIDAGLESAALGMAKQDTEFHKQTAGKKTFTADEIPSTVQGVRRTTKRFDPRGEGTTVEVPREDIPAYEVKPDMYKSRMEQAIEINSQYIPDARAREQWVNQQKFALENEYGRLIVASTKEQKTAIQSKRAAQYELAMQEGKWEIARELVLNMEIEDERKQFLVKQVDKKEVLSAYNKLMALDDETGLIDAKANLQNTEYDGPLNEHERNAAVNSIDADLNRIAGNRQSNRTAKNKEDKRYIQQTTQSIIAGADLSTEVVSRAQDLAANLDDPALYRELQYAIGMQGIKAEMVQQPGSIQIQEARSFQAAATHDPYLAAIGVKLLNQAQKNQKAINTNTRQYALDNGIIKDVPLNYDKLTETLSLRMAQHRRLLAQFGNSEGVFTNREMNAFAEKYESMSLAQRKKTNEDIAAMGDDAWTVIDQLKSKGLLGNAPFISELMKRGESSLANDVMNGEQLRQRTDVKNMMSSITRKLDTQIGVSLGSSYQYDNRQRQQIISSVKNAYAADANRNGRLETNNMDPGKVDEIVNKMVGPKISYRTNNIRAPRPDVTQDQFAHWIHNLSPRAIESMGMPVGYTSKQLLASIKNGTMELIDKGTGVYYLKPKGSSVFIEDARTPGKGFKFTYNPNAMTYTQAKWELERGRGE